MESVDVDTSEAVDSYVIAVFSETPAVEVSKVDRVYLDSIDVRSSSVVSDIVDVNGYKGSVESDVTAV